MHDEWTTMSVDAKSTESFEQSRNIFRNSLTLCLWQLPGSRHMSAGRQVVTQHVGLHSPDCCDGGARLIDYIKAGPLIGDHLLQPADLAFNPAQPGKLPAVIRQWVRYRFSPSAPHVLETAYTPVSIHTLQKENTYGS